MGNTRGVSLVELTEKIAMNCKRGALFAAMKYLDITSCGCELDHKGTARNIYPLGKVRELRVVLESMGYKRIKKGK